MSNTVVTTRSWGSRIGGAFKGILIGLGLIAAAVCLLFWNEGRTVKTFKALKETQGITVEADSAKVDAQFDGKCVHMTGSAATDDLLTDPTFGVEVNAIHLRRNVEMFQYIEHVDTKTERKPGGSETTTRTYSYSQDWSATLNDSSGFHDQSKSNPAAMPYESETWDAKNVRFGAFRLSDAQIGMIGNYEVYAVAAPEAEPEPELVQETAPAVGEAVPDTAPAPESDGRKYVNHVIYFGADPAKPAIGDVRVSFELVPATQDVSIVAVQTGDTFTSYTAKNGKSVNLLYSGTRTAEEMFASAQKANSTLGWILRIVGFILMFIGFAMIFEPLAVLGDVLPILGDIVRFGTKSVSFILSLVVSLVVIAIAWLWFRPWVAIPLLVVSAALLVYLRGKLKKQR